MTDEMSSVHFGLLLTHMLTEMKNFSCVTSYFKQEVQWDSLKVNGAARQQM